MIRFKDGLLMALLLTTVSSPFVIAGFASRKETPVVRMRNESLTSLRGYDIDKDGKLDRAEGTTFGDHTIPGFGYTVLKDSPDFRNLQAKYDSEK